MGRRFLCSVLFLTHACLSASLSAQKPRLSDLSDGWVSGNKTNDYLASTNEHRQASGRPLVNERSEANEETFTGANSG